MNDKMTVIIVMILSIFAVVQLVRLVSLALFCPRPKGRILTVIVIDEHTNDAEFLLRSALIRMRWLGIRNNRIVAVNRGANNQTVSICRILSRTYPEIDFVEYDTMLQKIFDSD